jgi:hypothetical protein
MTAAPAPKKFRFDSFACEFANSGDNNGVDNCVDGKLLDQTADNDSGIGESFVSLNVLLCDHIGQTFAIWAIKKIHMLPKMLGYLFLRKCLVYIFIRNIGWAAIWVTFLRQHLFVLTFHFSKPSFGLYFILAKYCGGLNGLPEQPATFL